MMRAIYRWHVKPGREDDFIRIWSSVTKYIRGNVKGARGSMLMRSRTNPAEFVALARWDSFDDWKAAREAAERNPTADPQAGNYDSFSAEPLEVIDDLLDYGE